MKTLPYSKENISFARLLRKNMTKEERHLWYDWYDFLRTYPVKFYKQRRIGNYIADFYCKEAGLIIELDGGQHYDEAGMKSDQERTAVLEFYGLTLADVKSNYREHEALLQKAETIARSLPEPTCTILRLCYYEHLTYREVAQQLGISPDTVKKHISKALRTLREAMKE